MTSPIYLQPQCVECGSDLFEPETQDPETRHLMPIIMCCPNCHYSIAIHLVRRSK
jgi:hypothetical protein